VERKKGEGLMKSVVVWTVTLYSFVSEKHASIFMVEQKSDKKPSGSTCRLLYLVS
jgi:hypothetical protein